MASPQWGPAAAECKEFRWPAWCGGEIAERVFDTCRESVGTFGLQHNDAVRFMSGPWAGNSARVLGTHLGCLWVQLAGDCAARDIKHCFTASDLVEAGVVKAEPEEHPPGPPPPHELPEAEEAEVPPAPDFRPALDDAERASFAYSGPQGEYTFQCRQEDCAPFGFFHGQHLRATRGLDRGRHCIVIGVSCGVLWVHWYGDAHASPLLYCHTHAELMEKYCFQETVPPAALLSSVRAAALAESCRSGAEPVAAAAALGGWDPLPTPNEGFEYPAPFGEMRVFDIGPCVQEKYGVRHGQRLRLQRGLSKGKCAVVIGINSGTLWLHIDGDRSATACHYCSNEAELHERYKYVPVDDVVLQPQVPYYGASYGTVDREREVARIRAVRLTDDWDESMQPQTYRFMRAYARWRLPDTVPKGSSFMMFYKCDTALRTAEALENLGTLRRFWQLQRSRGVPSYNKAFSAATEKEMFHALQRVPLQALTILSAALGEVGPRAASRSPRADQPSPPRS
eukprot:TRINITY_DN47449_c0_g1_i1.p1 TRINITY_DN47449_c0_g1~~TRINITY_DN47449_c0_g1_i1.p1  ORF type:complete len:510 (+),score=121.54 TRINITY_DN47449_c0_g1_i1:73-1602(+)